MNICVIGVGYVGLVSAACFSEFGWNVTCLDKDIDRARELMCGKISFLEPGLNDLVARNVAADRLTFDSNLATAVSAADICVLAVGAPMQCGDRNDDVSYVLDAVKQLAPHLNGFTVIATLTTVPVGTGQRVERVVAELRPDADVVICSNPEFLREGSAITDFMNPDRVLIGTDDERARVVMAQVYKPLSIRDVPVLFTSRESAELAKYAANAFLAMKISFINEVANLCERVGADVMEVATAIGRDHRIGDKFLDAGAGYGGSSFPKDVQEIIRTARENRSPLSLIETVQHVNEERKLDMEQRIRNALGGCIDGKTIGVLGVTFKPNTENICEAPSLTILPILAYDGASLRVYDPQGRRHGEQQLNDVEWCNNAVDVSENADALVILTDWDEFRALSLPELKKRMRGNIFVDLRNVFNLKDAEASGFVYHSIGRPSNPHSTLKGNETLVHQAER